MLIAIILRWREAATKRLASGESLVNSPTLPGLATLPGLDTLTGFTCRLGRALVAFCSRLAASGVTDAGAAGSPLLPPFLAGPGRFNLLL